MSDTPLHPKLCNYWGECTLPAGHDGIHKDESDPPAQVRVDTSSRPKLDRDAVDRGVEALCRFVFPGYFVPRHEMAVAVIYAIYGDENWRDWLPAKRIITTDGNQS